MEFRDSVELVVGVPLIVVTPALVELGKQVGVPVRYAGLLAMTVAMLLLACGDLALGGIPAGGDIGPLVGRWVLGGGVYGLAAAGLYSQGRQIGASGKDAALD